RETTRRGAVRDRGRDAARGSHRRRHRRRRQPLDRHPGRPDAGGRARKAAGDGRNAGQARHRTGRCGQGRIDRRAPQPHPVLGDARDVHQVVHQP
ncbi:hypothetical protein LTR94_036242, partial [Friedmanniomyces endolithicus]